MIDVHVDSLTDPLTLAELRDALSKTEKNKSPGTDGIPYEFYTQIWEIIGPHFLTIVHGVLEKGELLPSQGKAAIRLLPKVPNPKNMTDYRPISSVVCPRARIARFCAQLLPYKNGRAAFSRA